ncbi:MAG TPA: FAD-dependent oxidoreductase [Spirochaetia bacterium]|nr:FAD-dependent oxidoreductase [Spirochaetales bacterium]HRS65394.1 FAD-dependent oxidoreductase [Spirochaetia bacterium]HRV27483.1 FAD-dependent oxidoreductase [Spirochaetia bacterium]
MTTKIVIIGGGYAGVWAGKILEKHFRKHKDVAITLVDPKPYHTLMTELHEVAGWRTEPESVQVSFRKIFGARHINIVLDAIKTIDFEKKQAYGKAGTYDFDYCIIATGSEPEYFNIPGVKENSFSLWSFDDAMRLRHHIETVFRKAAEEPDSEKRKRLLTFAVAGAGFTGIEMLGELLDHRDVMCSKLHLNKDEVRIINIEALPSILPILEPKLREKAEKYLKKRGAELILNAAITGAEPGKIILKDGTLIETETFIWTCGVRGSSFSDSIDLEKPERSRGRLAVNEELRSTKYPYVFVGGDVSYFMENSKPLPQIVETAHQTAEVIAHNIIADIEHKEIPKQFKSNYHGFMISLGSHYAVANAGGLKTSGFIAMAMKHFINVLYLVQIAGINQVWEYIKHEFLDIKNNRSFIGGFAAYKIRSYWGVLLRMFLGFSWFAEGLNKIGEGWLAWSTGSKSQWMFSPGVIQATLARTSVTPEGASAASEYVDQAAQAVSSASEAVTQTVTQVADAASAASQTVSEAVTNGAQAAETVFGKILDLSKPIFNINGPVATWFRKTFMDGIAAHIPFELFQLMIVIVEIGVGLALFGGFFTWIAAAVSIVMCIVFTLSGMFSWDQLWFVFAAVLCLGGMGRAFGLDYFTVPLWKRWWNGTRFARKTHLYADEPTK